MHIYIYIMGYLYQYITYIHIYHFLYNIYLSYIYIHSIHDVQCIIDIHYIMHSTLNISCICVYIYIYYMRIYKYIYIYTYNMICKVVLYTMGYGMTTQSNDDCGLLSGHYLPSSHQAFSRFQWNISV